MRLSRYLARAGVASRRHSEELISQGRVTVNGEVVSEQGVKVRPSHDVVELDGHVIESAGESVVYAMNKPAGIVCTMHDEQGRRCVSDILPEGMPPGLFPIGRLDANTTGLLIFTNDGDLGHRLAHPSKGVWKKYEVVVEGFVTDDQIHDLEHGISLDDRMTAPAKVELHSRNERKSEFSISIHEGRNRQVRRMCEAIGHKVSSLHRTEFGEWSLGDLPMGEMRRID